MKRRQLINAGAIAATTSTILVACERTNDSPSVQANDLPNIRWRMVTSWPKSLDTIYGGAQTVCDRVAAMTGGRFYYRTLCCGGNCSWFRSFRCGTKRYSRMRTYG